MGEVSRVRNIKIAIFADHDPPHFHGRQAGRDSPIDIVTLELIQHDPATRHLSRTQLRCVREWARTHQDELLAAWDAIQAGEIPEKISGVPS